MIILVPRNGLEPLISRVRGECVEPVPLTRHREFFSGNCFWKNSLLLESFLCLLLCTACKEERKNFSLSFLHIYYIIKFKKSQIIRSNFPRRKQPSCLRGVGTFHLQQHASCTRHRVQGLCDSARFLLLWEARN